MIHPYRPNIFASSPLDRLDARRKDTGWITAQIAGDAARFTPVWRNRNLIAGDRASPAAGFIPPGLARHLMQTAPWAFLGAQDNRTLFTLDLSSLDTPPEAGGRYEDLRRIAGLLPEPDAAILAHARGLMHWTTRHRFCSTCGATCTAQSAGHVRACSGCGAHHFPRTDPAVIMLVTHQDRALLGHPARFKDLRIFTTLAGFVEPGESLEEAVARETYEEAGIRVGQVRYRSSQPWPFPASIMLGFTAVATTDTITVDPEELVEARWFSREELRAPEGFVLPPDMSIARRLIDEWVG